MVDPERRFSVKAESLQSDIAENVAPSSPQRRGEGGGAGKAEARRTLRPRRERRKKEEKRRRIKMETISLFLFLLLFFISATPLRSPRLRLPRASAVKGHFISNYFWTGFYDLSSGLVAIRRGDDGRDAQFCRGRRDAGDFSGAGLVRASRNNRERHEHTRARARRVVERLRLSRRDAQSAAKITLPADSERRGRRDRRGVAQTNPACYIRRGGPFSHPLRHRIVYATGAGSTLVAVWSFGAS